MHLLLTLLVATTVTVKDADSTVKSPQRNAEFGFAAAHGDVNGDGLDDVLIGARYFDNPQTNEGRAYLFPGTNDGMDTDDAWVAEGSNDNAQFGYSLATADVNGDGFDDILVGARWFSNPEPSEGAAFLFLGQSSVPNFGIADWSYETDEYYTWLGHSVASAGDVNGDGFDDVVVSLPAAAGTAGSNAGRVMLFLGSPSGLGAVPDWEAEGTEYYEEFGFDVAGAGDVNGDGYDDVIIGSHWWGEDEEGRATLYLGNADGLEPAPAWTYDGDQYRAFFGRAVAGAGDVNGDGYDDVIIGADSWDGKDTDNGVAYVFMGSAEGLSAQYHWRHIGAPNSRLGFSVASAGDVDRDGYADVLIGAPFFTGDLDREGWVGLFHGSEYGLDTQPRYEITSGEEGSRLGWAVSSAGDINADGFSDIIAGAPRMDEGNTIGGQAFVFLDPGPTGPWVEAGKFLTGEPNKTVVYVDGADFADPDSTLFTCTWNWGDGEEDSVEQCDVDSMLERGRHVYRSEGEFTVTLTVTDDSGLSGVDMTLASIAFETDSNPTAPTDPGCACAVTGDTARGGAIGASLVLLCLAWIIKTRTYTRYRACS